jgi:(p)ppGpp synthase/HD superfamily hydrolase
MDMTRIELAKAFAHEAHDSINQKRKHTSEPYWVHTDAVAELVASVGGTEDMIIASHLHDVLEDVQPLDKTGIYQAHVIGGRFGENVLRLVWELTDVFTKAHRPAWNRKKRKEEEHKRVAGISVEAKTIKLADIINNTESIVAHDPDFAKVYLAEIMETLPVLSEGNSSLLNRAAMQSVAAFATLGIPIPTIINA